MGLSIEQVDFSEVEFAAFKDRLQQSLRALRMLLQRDGFGDGPFSLGAELEVYIADDQGRPSKVCEELLRANKDPRLVHELNRFNLELNLTPVAAHGQPFTAMAAEMSEALDSAQRLAEGLDSWLLPVGILPTATPDQFGADAMTPLTRFKALERALQRERDGDFRIHIDGPEPLSMATDIITLEGANTAFQVHLRVPPDQFTDTYNAALLATPLVLAMSGNSPFLFGHRLWEETRIALFKQAIDIRDMERFSWREPARVTFGHGWLRSSPYEPFAETVSMYKPLLAPLSDEDPEAIVRAGGYPSLYELRLHMGTTWPWVRAVYDHLPEGHFRIELRVLPSGPTVEDMMASAALLVGLAVGTRDRMRFVLPAIPFKYAEHNFYRAAKHGLDTGLIWPTRGQTALREDSIQTISDVMLPMADEGLDEMGVDATDRRRWLGIIENRLQARMTGARWQALMVERLEARGLNRTEALQQMLFCYRDNNRSGKPVADWPLD